jgi:hypothetical protein
MAAVWPAGPDPIMTSFECILRVWVLRFALLREKGTELKPLDGIFFWFNDAAAANGRDIDERRGVRRVLRKAEANSLAV